MRKTGRPPLYKSYKIMSLRLESELYDLIAEIASLESAYSGTKISQQELCRNALHFCYNDGERLREIFRRSRENMTKRISRKEKMR
jgi:hypothetical protein